MDDRQIRLERKLSAAASKLRRPDVDKQVKSEAARRMSKQRVRPAGGRPAIVVACPHAPCDAKLSTRAMRKHIPRCPFRTAS